MAMNVYVRRGLPPQSGIASRYIPLQKTLKSEGGSRICHRKGVLAEVSVVERNYQ